MRSVRSDIQALKRAIEEDVRREADRILADAQARAENIRRRAEAQANAERDRILQQARQEAEREHGRVIAAAQLRAQTLKLERREQLLEHVFAEARQQLASILEWPDYAQIARRLVHEAAGRLEADELLIRADERTMQVLSDEVLADLEEEVGVHLRIGEPLTQGNGVIVVTPDGHRSYDNTLETRMARMQDGLRAPVYHILMGEAP